MWWIIPGLAIGGVVGFLLCSILTVGRQADLLQQLDDCEARVRRLVLG